LNGRIRKDVMRAHGFRKLTETSFIRSKVNAEAREMLMGHSIGLGDAYYRPDVGEILDEYLKAVDLLTVNEENRLKIRVKEMESKEAVHCAEWGSLRLEIGELRQKFLKH
jgi:hypothetical protein